MKKYTVLLAAAGFFSTFFCAAQQTKSGAPLIPIPSGDVRKSAPAAGAAPVIRIGKAVTSKLANGLSVIVVENHKLPRVSFRLFTDYTPALEGEVAGYVALMSGLLIQGTTTRSKAQIDQEVDFIGATLGSDANGLTGLCLSKHSERLLELLSDALLHPTFPQEEFEKAKTQAASTVAAGKDNANTIAANVGATLRFGKKHPYGGVMTEASIEKITLEQIRQHYQLHFHPSTTYLVIVGDLDQAAALKMAEKYFGEWKPARTPVYNYPPPQLPLRTEVAFVHKPGAVQSVVHVNYPVDLHPANPDVIPTRILNAVLGGIPIRSRLDANLRERRGYTYGARSVLAPDPLAAFFNASASVRNDVTDSSIVEILKEFRRIRNEKVSEQELQLMKNVLTGQFSQSLEQPNTIATFALNIARYRLPENYYENYLTNLQKVTAEDVQAVAQKYIQPDRAYILVVGNKEKVADRLKPFSADGKVYFFDPSGIRVEYAKPPIPAGVTAQTVVSDYVNAIGGAAKIAALKDVSSDLTVNMQGASLNMKILQKDGNKLANTIEMGGQVVSRRVYDGQHAYENGRPMEGTDLEDMKEQAWFVKEANYASAGYKLTLKDIEALDGKYAYVLEVERSDGKKSTEYYDQKTSLKLREVSTQAGPGGRPATVTTDFADYKEVAGLLFPHTIGIAGAAPVPMKGIVQKIAVNAGVEDSVFEQK